MRRSPVADSLQLGPEQYFSPIPMSPLPGRCSPGNNGLGATHKLRSTITRASSLAYLFHWNECWILSREDCCGTCRPSGKLLGPERPCAFDRVGRSVARAIHPRTRLPKRRRSRQEPDRLSGALSAKGAGNSQWLRTGEKDAAHSQTTARLQPGTLGSRLETESFGKTVSAELVFACRNEGYYAFDASFATETTSDVVGLGEPRKGKLIVKAPVGKAEWNFNYDFAQISSTVPNRKDDCVVDWHVRRLSSNEFVGTGKTLVSVITES